jgi:hypothetical protein
LDDWLRSYIEYTAYCEAPDIFHFWSGVSAIAGALRRKVYIDQEYFSWTPNFYIVLVAPPAIGTKSTAMNLAAALLREIEGVRFGPDCITWQALPPALSAASEMVLMPDAMYHPMSCLTFASSELGSLLDLKDRRMVEVLTDLWDGNQRVWKKETKFSGSDTVPNPWMNIIACTTPGWLADNIPRVMIGGGLTSRIVFVYANYKKCLRAYPRKVISNEARNLRPQLIHDLEAISMMKGEYFLTPEAEEYGEQWYEEHHKKPPAGLSHCKGLEGYLSRKQGHVHKLAIVLAAASSSELLITKDILQSAVRMMTAVERDLPRVFRFLTTTAEMENAETIVLWVQENGAISRTELYQQFFHVMPIKAFNEVLDSAVSAGLLRVVQKGNDILILPVGTISEEEIQSSEITSRIPDTFSDTVSPSEGHCPEVPSS